MTAMKTQEYDAVLRQCSEIVMSATAQFFGGSMGKKFPTIRDGLWSHVSLHSSSKDCTRQENLHVVVISPDSEREAAMNLSNITTRSRTSQRAARQHSFLLLIEADSAEFFPIADELVFDDDLVNRQLALFATN
jgi:hypothetical protein